MVTKPPHSLNQPLSRRGLFTVLGVIAFLVVASLVAVQVYRHLSARPKSPAQVKKLIATFLRQETGRTDFTTTIPPALTNQTELAGSSDQTNSPPLQSLPGTLEFLEKIATAPDYKTTYGLIGERLWIADQLLARTNVLHQESAVLIAAEISDVALNSALHQWLGARIAEAYLLPAIDLANSPEAKRINPDELLRMTDAAFQKAGETNNIIRTYYLMIAKGTRPDRADKARYRLIRLYEQQGKFQQALDLLHQIQRTNEFVLRRITDLENRLKNR